MAGHRALRARRIAVTAGLLMATTTAVVAGGATSAYAGPPGCVLVQAYGTDSTHIYSWAYWDCNTYQIPLATLIQRYVSPSTWTTVASGSGMATYTCNGTALNIYRATGVSQFFDTCG
jgi:hypothetical protein